MLFPPIKKAGDMAPPQSTL